MRSSFELAGDLRLEIAGNVPRTEHDPASVCLNMIRTHVPRVATWETDLEVAATEAIDRHLANMSWASGPAQTLTRDEVRTLIAGNVRGFFGALNQARTAPDEATVLRPVLDLLRTPLMHCTPLTPGYGPAYVQPPDETIMSISLKPSHARAIASAMLSAATEAKR